MTTFISPETVRETVATKGTKFTRVTFLKKDGTVRTKTGLFRPLSHIKGTGRPTPNGFIAIWSPHESNPTDTSGDPEKGRWGMFRVDHVISMK
jgi:hypothetical protein